MLSYAICTTPRTGSTYLCTLLREAGLGNPDEWLHPSRHRSWLTLEDLRTERAENGVFGIKLFWSHREDHAIIDFDDVLPSERSTWIYLRRRDTRSQAQSYLTAVARDEWADVKVPYLEFPSEAISQWDSRLQRWNADWQSWFRRKRIHPLRITYEELVSDPDAVVESISHLLYAQPVPLNRRSQQR